MPNCNRQTVISNRWGIYEGPDNVSTFSTDPETLDSWILTIEDPHLVGATFIPIDGCLTINKPNGDKDKRCDCAITYPANTPATTLVLIELKDQNDDTISKPLAQLRSVIDRHLAVVTQGQNYPMKIALVANKKHASLAHELTLSRMEALEQATGFILMGKNRYSLD